MKKALLIGFLLLFGAAYLDNSRGPLVPILANVFQISYGTTTWFLVLGNLGAVAGLLGIVPMLRSFSIVQLARGSLLFFCGLAVFLFWVKNLFTLFLFAGFLGAVIPVLGGLANLFVMEGSPIESRSKWFCGLHLFYGTASLIAPFVCAFLLGKELPWFAPFLACIPLVLIILTVLGFEKNISADESVLEKSGFRLSRGHLLAIGIFCLYVAGEVMMSMWMVAYLESVVHLSLSESSRYLSGFFVTMTLSRALCFFSLKESTEIKVLFGCVVLSMVFFFLGHFGYLICFAFAGILGPFFPIFLSLCTQKFPAHSRSFTMWLLASTQAALALLNLIVGKLSDLLGMATAYYVPIILLILTLIFLGVFFLPKKEGTAVSPQ